MKKYSATKRTAVALALLGGVWISATEEVTEKAASMLSSSSDQYSGFSSSPDQSGNAGSEVRASLEEQKELRRAFLAVALGHEGEATKLALSLLKTGLESDGTRKSSARYVESLLVDVAHGKVSVHPAILGTWNELVALYKKRAPEQISRMRESFPESPTLAYLSKN